MNLVAKIYPDQTVDLTATLQVRVVATEEAIVLRARRGDAGTDPVEWPEERGIVVPRFRIAELLAVIETVAREALP